MGVFELTLELNGKLATALVMTTKGLESWLRLAEWAGWTVKGVRRVDH